MLQVGSPAEEPQSLGFPAFNVPSIPFIDPTDLRAVDPLPADVRNATKFIKMAGIQTVVDGAVWYAAPPAGRMPAYAQSNQRCQQGDTGY